MKKIIFLIHDLGQGGAEKVLVNLVNNMNKEKFDITVLSLFGGGVNEQYLSKSIKYISIFKKIFPGNSRLMKLFNPKHLHKIFIKEKFDIEVSYLEGPSARIISGCCDDDTKLVSWIHVEQKSLEKAIKSFRNEKEAKDCYEKFDQTVCVSNTVKEDFCNIFNFKNKCDVLYNTVESDKIIELSKVSLITPFDNNEINLIAVGTLKKSKGFDRLINITKLLVDNDKKVHLYILGKGDLKDELLKQVKDCNLENNVTFLGYDTNPYKYVSKCDLFVCASHAEGFSTAATEALIVGTPVCTVEVSGMKEMLGYNNEYGVVCENDDEALYNVIKELLDNPQLLAHYKQKAIERGKEFSTEKTVKAVEDMLESL